MTRGRVIRDGHDDGDGRVVRPAALGRDLSDLTLAAFDPARIEAAMADGYREGFAAGHREGYEAGHEEGMRSAEESLDNSRRQLGAVLVALRDQLHGVAVREEQLLRATEVAIAQGALELAAAIIGREVATAADPGRDAIARALALVPTGAAEATARLHPGDAERLGSLADLHLGEIVTVVADPDVEPGGCVLAAGESTIDTQLGAALQRARARLLGEHG